MFPSGVNIKGSVSTNVSALSPAVSLPQTYAPVTSCRSQNSHQIPGKQKQEMLAPYKRNHSRGNGNTNQSGKLSGCSTEAAMCAKLRAAAPVFQKSNLVIKRKSIPLNVPTREGFAKMTDGKRTVVLLSSCRCIQAMHCSSHIYGSTSKMVFPLWTCLQVLKLSIFERGRGKVTLIECDQIMNCPLKESFLFCVTFWRKQTEKHLAVFQWTPSMAEKQAAPSSRSFNTDVYVARSCSSRGRMLEISQGWDARDSFLPPILDKHSSHPLSTDLCEVGRSQNLSLTREENKKKALKEKKP